MGDSLNDTQRLPYIDPALITDPAMMAEFQRAAREGAPRPESHARQRTRSVLGLCQRVE